MGGIKLFHKVTFEQSPKVLNNYLQHSLVRSDIARLVRKPCIKFKSLTAKTKNSLFHRTCHIYNQLPDNIRIANKKRFLSKVKIFIRNNFDLKSIQKID